MYQFTYAEVVEDLPQEMRAREHDALARCVDMLEAAQRGRREIPETPDGADLSCAVSGRFSSRISSGNGNDLPEDLRAQLISIGIWVMKEIERLRTRRDRILRRSDRNQRDHSRRTGVRRPCC